MNVCIVTPVPARSRRGNRITALRWARLLRELGHRVTVARAYKGERCDVLVAIHARKSYRSIAAFYATRPGRPLIVALGGTDLYRDIHADESARRALQLASRIVVLQALGIDELPASLRSKARVIHQSASRPPGRFRPRADVFEVCVLGHLRPVKDPFRAALAARRLPASSKVRIVQVGGALTPEMEAEARRREAEGRRYRWVGERPRWQALRILVRSRLLALTSRSEGGANVISEALACGVPIVSSRIPGSVGILGEDYPGYFPVGDTAALAQLLERAERDAGFYGDLESRCAALAPLVRPSRERDSWRRLLEELGRTS